MAFCTSGDWQQMLEERILPEALAHVDLGTDVVEIGPAVGFTTEIMCRRVERVTAVEIDPGLAARLRERLAEAPVTVVEGDGRATGLESGTFTGAVSFNMLHHVPTDDDQDRIFAELNRLLRPGGALVLSDGSDSEGVRAFHQGDTYHPIDPDGMVGRLERAGFSEVRTATHEFGWYGWATKPGTVGA